MENRFPTKNRVFLDTSFSLAPSIKAEVNHVRATKLSVELARLGTKIFTTQAIILEIGNAFARNPVSVLCGQYYFRVERRAEYYDYSAIEPTDRESI